VGIAEQALIRTGIAEGDAPAKGYRRSMSSRTWFFAITGLQCGRWPVGVEETTAPPPAQGPVGAEADDPTITKPDHSPATHGGRIELLARLRLRPTRHVVHVDRSR
jgi:hypothetical protein